jgi:Cu+-exporting ATPase
MILQVNCLVFDKTGTLTIGKPVVVNTRLLKNMVLRDFYELIAAAEVSFLFINSLLRLSA